MFIFICEGVEGSLFYQSVTGCLSYIRRLEVEKNLWQVQRGAVHVMLLLNPHALKLNWPEVRLFVRCTVYAFITANVIHVLVT